MARRRAERAYSGDGGLRRTYSAALGDIAQRHLEGFAVKMKDGPCAYCGTTDTERTKGHVIPRSVFPDSMRDVQRITVPECTSCQAIWDDVEPQFRNIMVGIRNPEKIVPDSCYKNMRRSFLKCDGRRRLEDIAEVLVSVDTPNGPREEIYPAKDPGFNLILRRIVRGLCHHHDLGTAIADSRVTCDVMRFIVPEAFRPEFTWNEIAPDFCRYGYAILEDGNMHSFWLIRFSKHIEFFGTIAASESGFAGW